MIVSSRAAVETIGEEKFGFKSSDTGTHSLRSGVAMAMFLEQVLVYTIMMLGRWSSDAFPKYIRKQVEQFSHNASKRIIKTFMYCLFRLNQILDSVLDFTWGYGIPGG